MGQTRTDTPEQRAAKIRGAERRRCPKCKRGNALSRYDDGWVVGQFCRYCDFARGYDRDTEQHFVENAPADEAKR